MKSVTPAQAGNQGSRIQEALGPRLRGGDDKVYETR
jgi:hypothetical protein